MRVLDGRSWKEERERQQSARILAAEFARQRGWVRAQSLFSLEQLARRTSKILGDGTSLSNRDAVFYREKRRPCRPAAIAVHCSPWPEIGLEVERIAEQFGLRYEAVLDFPAWVDGAQLVIFTPTEPLRLKQRRGRREPCAKQLTLPFD